MLVKRIRRSFIWGVVFRCLKSAKGVSFPDRKSEYLTLSGMRLGLFRCRGAGSQVEGHARIVALEQGLSDFQDFQAIGGLKNCRGSVQ